MVVVVLLVAVLVLVVLLVVVLLVVVLVLVVLLVLVLVVLAAAPQPDAPAGVSIRRLSEIQALLRSGGLEGEDRATDAPCCSSWEQSTPSAVAWMKTPPSILWVVLGELRRSLEAPGDGGRGLKSSGVLEEMEGGAGGGGPAADWTPLRMRA